MTRASGQFLSWQAQRDGLRSQIYEAGRQRLPLVMGILNATPDSFWQESATLSLREIGQKASLLIEDGAQILDVGGESTRPGAEALSEKEEYARVIPAIKTLASLGCPALSIDTYKSGVAGAAVDLGAVMINDVTGLTRDSAMAPLCAQTGALVVLTHPEGLGDDVLTGFRRFFDAAIERATFSGILRQNIILDPGIGFGKTDAENFAAIAHIDRLNTIYGLPILIGASRKSFLGRILGRDVEDRLPGTLAAHLLSGQKGAAILRVHDVKAHNDALKILQKVTFV